MDLRPNNSFEPDVRSYSRLQDIFSSWFWRYYDHLFQLIFYNFCWFLTCFAVFSIARFFHFLPEGPSWNWFRVYIVFLLECAGSVIWSIAVFKIFNDESISWKTLLRETRFYFWKALGIASLFGLFLGLALYNLRFYLSFHGISHVFIFLLMGLVATFLIYGLMMMFYQWPILYFQNCSLPKTFYRSFIIVLSSGFSSIFLLVLTLFLIFLFALEPVLLFFIGFVFPFSLWVVALEKNFLRYKITYKDRPLSDYLEWMDKERQRGWRDILRPWETR